MTVEGLTTSAKCGKFGAAPAECRNNDKSVSKSSFEKRREHGVVQFEMEKSFYFLYIVFIRHLPCYLHIFIELYVIKI